MCAQNDKLRFCSSAAVLYVLDLLKRPTEKQPTVNKYAGILLEVQFYFKAIPILICAFHENHNTSNDRNKRRVRFTGGGGWHEDGWFVLQFVITVLTKDFSSHAKQGMPGSHCDACCQLNPALHKKLLYVIDSLDWLFTPILTDCSSRMWATSHHNSLNRSFLKLNFR